MVRCGKGGHDRYVSGGRDHINTQVSGGREHMVVTRGEGGRCDCCRSRTRSHPI